MRMTEHFPCRELVPPYPDRSGRSRSSSRGRRRAEAFSTPRYGGTQWEGNVASNNHWQTRPNGCLTAVIGDVQMLVEPVGGSFRVLVTRNRDKLNNEEILASASAVDAGAAITLAERMAARHVVLAG